MSLIRCRRHAAGLARNCIRTAVGVTRCYERENKCYREEINENVLSFRRRDAGPQLPPSFLLSATLGADCVPTARNMLSIIGTSADAPLEFAWGPTEGLSE